MIRSLRNILYRIPAYAGITSVLFLVSFLLSFPTHAAEKYVDVFERVMKTGTIRCAYLPWDVLFIKDPNTGNKSGIFHDYVLKIGEELKLKIEWTEEVTVENWPIGLDAGRYDVFCSSLVPIASRARLADYSIPILYHSIRVYTQADNKRFDGNLASLNDPKVTLVSFDGTSLYSLSKELFPNAKVNSLALMADQTADMLDVATGKADALLSYPSFVNKFMVGNPGKLREVSGIGPVATFPSVMAVKAGEDRLRRMIDNATRDLLNRGYVEHIISKYEDPKGSILRVAKPYQGSE